MEGDPTKVNWPPMYIELFSPNTIVETSFKKKKKVKNAKPKLNQTTKKKKKLSKNIPPLTFA